MEAQSIDCRGILRPLSQGSLTDYCPPRPLYLLPFYHGRLRYDMAKKMLNKTGDYILFVDSINDQPSLCVRDDSGVVHKQPIIKRPQGCYGIDGRMSHHNQGLPNIDQLIAYYVVYGLPIKDEKVGSGKWLRLENAVQIRDETSKPSDDRRRPFKEPGQLEHFHFVIAQNEAERRLLKDGDFLVRQNPQKPDDYIVSIRQANSFSHRYMEREPSTGLLYTLPRQNAYEPLESVHMLDEWIQLHIVYEIAVDGKRLTTPVPRPPDV